MKTYESMTKEELLQEKAALEAQYQEFKDAGLKLDMSRGKPSREQLDLSRPMLSLVDEESTLCAEDGTDVRNYGGLDGIVEARQWFADMIECKPENVLVFGNSSLNIMYDTVARSFTHGVLGSTPWSKLDKVKFICPVPGYDRHFAITEHFGVEMILVPMHEDGPDMDLVEQYVNTDAAVKGMWCIPKYSNPTGATFSDEVVRRIAALKPAAEDFRIYWDNAYCVHHIYEGAENQDRLLNIIEECEKAGNPNMVYEFCSTSKVTFAGAGVAAMATSKENIAFVKKTLTIQTIGHDKINQLRHVRFLPDKAALEAHMMKHATLLRPKFEMVESMLTKEVKSRGIGSWVHPKGGYFICFEAMEGCAKRIVAMAKEAGVVLTGAGAPFPYGKDPKDSVIRIAPSFPSVEELEKAAEVFVCCVRLASVEKLLEA